MNDKQIAFDKGYNNLLLSNNMYERHIKQLRGIYSRDSANSRQKFNSFSKHEQQFMNLLRTKKNERYVAELQSKVGSDRRKVCEHQEGKQ